MDVLAFLPRILPARRRKADNDWENPLLQHRNRLDPRTDGFPYPTEEQALAEVPGLTPLSHIVLSFLKFFFFSCRIWIRS